MKKPTPPETPSGTAPASERSTAKHRRIDPFAHAGKPGWGVGGRYTVGQDGVRRPAEQPEPNKEG